MDDTQAILSLMDEHASERNKTLMKKFKTALESDPAADLLSIFDKKYRYEHRRVCAKNLSELGQFNLITLSELHDIFEKDSEADLLSKFPIGYSRRRAYKTASTTTQPIKEKADRIPTNPDFRKKLDDIDSARVVYPISVEVHNLLSSQTLVIGEPLDHQLVACLKHLIWNSPKIWECYGRGVVVKCSDDIVAKVVRGEDDHTEYTALQYLARSAPDIPAPRPHGSIAFGPFRVVFQSFVSGTTLADAWPTLSMQQKTSVQQELNGILLRLRSITKPLAQNLGGVNGEGVKSVHIHDYEIFQGIATAAQYRDLQFSAAHHGSKTYVKLLHSLFDAGASESDEEVVFSHGDVRPANIIIEMKPGTDDLKIAALIDWEDAGFYPDYYESMAATRTLSVKDDNDWFLYLPDCISPLKYPRKWLVDRLWGIHLWTT